MTREELERRNARRMLKDQQTLRQMYERERRDRARECAAKWGRWDQPTQDVIRRNQADKTKKELEIFR